MWFYLIFNSSECIVELIYFENSGDFLIFSDKVLKVNIFVKGFRIMMSTRKKKE